VGGLREEKICFWVAIKEDLVEKGDGIQSGDEWIELWGSL
jgi:hypothetical protein